MSTPQFQHATPPFRTFCGENALDALPRELDRMGCRRAAVFCGASIPGRHANVLQRVENALGERLAGRFDGVLAHAPIAAVQAGRGRLEDLRADAVIAVGGGSAVVTARAATILLAEDGDPRDLCTTREANGRLSSPRLLAPKLSQWVVPSTPTTAYAKAGSAVRDPTTGERLALFDPKTRAQGIFIDPEMALTAPFALALASALNAFSMAVEGLQSPVDDPLADALLIHSLGMLARWLPRLHAAPGDAEPRVQLMLAALLCGQGSDHVGGGLAQALSHAAGPRSSSSNGVVEALLLPHAMRYNAAVTSVRLGQVANALEATAQTSAAPEERAIAAVEQVLRTLDVPARLRDAGVARDALPEIVAQAMDDWSLTRVPRPTGHDELTDLLNAAW